MAGWEGLRVELRRLMAEAPGALRALPDPDSELARTPVRIMLAAWATEIAAGLQATYPELVELEVGFMRYPAAELVRNVWVPELHRGPAAEIGIDVEVLAPLVVRSGWVRRRGRGESVGATSGRYGVDRSRARVRRTARPLAGRPRRTDGDR